jgi:hypothetical protein
MSKKKEYLFWKDVRKHVREECVIEANTIEEATEKLHGGGYEFEEVDVILMRLWMKE